MKTTNNNETTFRLIQGSIFRLGYVRSIYEFKPMHVLMELKKGTGMTVAQA